MKIAHGICASTGATVLEIQFDDGSKLSTAIDSPQQFAKLSQQDTICIVVAALNHALESHVIFKRGEPALGAYMREKGKTIEKCVELVDVERREIRFDGEERLYRFDEVEYAPQ